MGTKRLLEILEAVRWKHRHTPWDEYHSCPAHPDFGSHAEIWGTDCNCGADEANVLIDEAVRIIEAIEDKERSE